MNMLIPTPRRTILALLIASVALALTACVPSDKSVVTDDKQVFLEELIGDWKVKGAGDATIATFAKGDGKSYDVSHVNPRTKERGHAILRVMKLGDEHFYELEIKEKDDPKPRLAFGKLTFDRAHMTGLTFADGDKMLTDPAVTTAESADPNDNTGKQRVVSMPAEKVQAYLVAHSGEMKTEMLKLERVESKR